MQKPLHSTGNRLDIVVPCYNEEEVLPRTVEELRQLLEQLKEAGYDSPREKCRPPECAVGGS